MKRRGRPPYPDLLTPREQEVLALLREGLSNEQIAERLGVSLAGAKYHVSEILGKLGVSSREEAARWRAEGRPWWLAALAPFDALRHRLTWAPQLAFGAAVVGIAAGVALLLWGLTRTNGDETPSITTACPGGPTAPQGTSPLFAYTASDKTVWVIDVDGNNATQLICNGSGSAAWSPSGRYISHIAADGSLRILDVEAGQDLVVDDGTNGSVLYTSDPASAYMSWSPVDDILVFEKYDGVQRVSLGLWRVEPGGVPTRLAPAVSRFEWAPDGANIAYELPRVAPATALADPRKFEIRLMRSNGTGDRKIAEGFLSYTGGSWSRDGRLLAYWNEDRGGSARIGDIYVMDVDSGRQFPLREFTSDEQPGWSSNNDRYIYYNMLIDPDSQSATPLFDPANSLIDWSPDGMKVAYVRRNAGDSSHSFVILDTTTGKRSTYETSSSQIWVHQPGYQGVWSPDSRYYAFVGAEPGTDGAVEGRLYVADTQTGATRRVLETGAAITYALDGSHLLVGVGQGPQEQPSVWTADPDGFDLRKVADGSMLTGPAGLTPWRPSSE